MTNENLAPRVKELIVRRLKLDIDPTTIQSDAPLFGEGLGLDSIDALEIVVMLESEFGIRVKNEGSARENFRSISAKNALTSWSRRRSPNLQDRRFPPRRNDP